MEMSAVMHLQENKITMAELTNQNSGRTDRNGKIRSKRHSTKIDMTPMVDLAFLLLTFFILTATLTKSHEMPLTMPDEEENPEPRRQRVNENNVLHIALQENNKVYWWMGNDEPVQTDYTRHGLRKLFLEKRQTNPNLFILVKPGAHSRYENIIDLLDELQIAKMERYSIVDLTKDDEAKVAGITPAKPK
jgi:biopolymer transport protein ExbD